MAKTSVAIFVLVAILATVIAKKCVPGDNCKLPNCRCWDDPKAPGGFGTRDIPQMILLSFDYGVSSANIKEYGKLMEGIVNPNKCKVRGSFYVTQTYTDFKITSNLFKMGHEVGVSTIAATSPVTKEEFAGNFSVVKKELVKAGVPEESITGARSVELAFGGTNQLAGMKSNKLQYDSTCLNNRFHTGLLQWPYTYDYVETIPQCTAAQKVTKPFPGVWEFPIADLHFKGNRCAVPSACTPFLKTDKDAYNLFFNTFTEHYNQETRPPFVMIIDPAWITKDYQVSGTRQFLQFVGAAFEDTWIVTTQQALAWIQKPVPASKASQFEPWGCKRRGV